MDTERIAKRIARAGLASRREAEAWIAAGRVAVNGAAVSEPGTVVGPRDRVTVDGAPLPAPPAPRLWLHHKPAGLVTTESDEKGRETVFDALPPELGRVLSVGRLDLTSEGLLLLTNDGALKRFMELPDTGWTRRYRARVHGTPTDAALEALRRGVSVDGEDFAPMDVGLDREMGRNAWLTLGLREGRNREVRRACEAVGLVVTRLIRVSYGPFQLGELAPGGVEEVRPRVLRDQLGPDWAEGIDRAMAEDRNGRDGRGRPKGPRGGGARSDGARGDGPRKPRHGGGGKAGPRADRPGGNRPGQDGATPDGSRSERPRREGGSAAGRPPRGDRPDRGSRPDRGDRPQRGDRAARGPGPGGKGGAPKDARSDRGDRPQRGGGAGRPSGPGTDRKLADGPRGDGKRSGPGRPRPGGDRVARDGARSGEGFGGRPKREGGAKGTRPERTDGPPRKMAKGATGPRGAGGPKGFGGTGGPGRGGPRMAKPPTTRNDETSADKPWPSKKERRQKMRDDSSMSLRTKRRGSATKRPPKRDPEG